jgi:threonine/homoserine/homoserine lactone efflux protein
MTIYGLMTFSAIYALAVATPGPGVAAIVARSLSRGTQGAAAFIAGFMVGDLIWFTAAATGLAALAQTAYAVFVVVKYAGAVYLLYLAYKLWTAPVQAVGEAGVDEAQTPFKLFLGSLSLTLGNPKTAVFFLALLPTVIRLETLTVPAFLEIAGVIAVLLPAILWGYTWLAARARRLFRSPGSLKIINRGTGAAMAGAAVVVASR